MSTEFNRVCGPTISARIRALVNREQSFGILLSTNIKRNPKGIILITI